MQPNNTKVPSQETPSPKIVNFRQPMVTASGIFLGFMLNFAANWISDAFTKYIFRDIVLSMFSLVSIALLMTVLFRILNMDYPVHKAKDYYQQTLKLFIAGISMPFISFILVIIHKLITK